MPPLDAEQARGLAVAGAVVVAVGTGLYLFLDDDLPPIWRAGAAVVVLVVALFAASTNWRPHSLRIAGLLAVLLTFAILVSIGRDAQRTEDADTAARELDRTALAFAELEEEFLRQEEDPKRSRQAVFNLANGQLKVAIDELVPPDDVANTAARAQLRAFAVQILNGLNGSDPADINRVKAAFGEQLVALPESDATTNLSEAVDAAIEARQRLTPPSRTTGSAAIAATCALVAPPAGETGCAAQTAPVEASDAQDTAPVASTLPVALAVTRLRLAEYQEEVLHRDVDAVRVAAARDAVQAAVGDAAESTEESTSLLVAVGTGANKVVTEAVGGEPPIAIEVVGWVVLAAVALLFWRSVERRSFAQLAGPVTITLTTAKSADEKTTDEAMEAAFRTAVLRNLSEPGALPGASAIQPITDLLELPGVDKTWYTPIVTALKNVMTAPRGCAITADIVPPNPPAGKWRILVRVTDLATGADVDVSTQQAETAFAACRAAGYWASAVVLGRSTRIPGWAHWDKDTASALAIFDDPDTLEVKNWAAATARAPASGLLLIKLAQAHDLKGQQIESLTMAARAVAAHPRFMIARYRLAASLNMLGDDATAWVQSSAATRKRVVKQIRRAGDAIGVRWPGGSGPEQLQLPPQQPKSDFLHTLATSFYDRIDLDLGWPRLVLRSLRRSERDIWWAAGLTKFGRHGPRYRAKWSVRSARLVSQTASDCSAVEARARRNWSWFQLSYNLACFHARRGDPDGALTWLETSLERPGSWQVTDGWLEVDPDLVAIRGTARYAWVREQVMTSTDEE